MGDANLDFVAIDPGKHACGVAVFYDGKLYGAYYPMAPRASSRVSQWIATATAVSVHLIGCKIPIRDLGLVCEVPKARKERTDAADDLLDLAGVLGALAPRFRAVLWDPRPEEWKGQIPKDVTHKRLETRLSASERFRLDATLKAVAPSVRHNALDAVALGVEYVLRKNRGQLK